MVANRLRVVVNSEQGFHGIVTYELDEGGELYYLASTDPTALPPYADTVGYCRAVRDGRHIYVSGTAPVGIDSDDPYEQAKRCLTIIVDALRELGAAPEHVVRTRVYIVDPADWEAVGRAHGEVFAEIRPASAMLVITGTLDPAWKVEIEADALLPE